MARMRVYYSLLLAIELSLHCHRQTCDQRSKFEEDLTKTVVAIVYDRYFRQTHRQIDRSGQNY